MKAEDEDDICPWCNGSGEGQYDGSTCSSCKGRGVARIEPECDEPERDDDPEIFCGDD